MFDHIWWDIYGAKTKERFMESSIVHPVSRREEFLARNVSSGTSQPVAAVNVRGMFSQRAGAVHQVHHQSTAMPRRRGVPTAAVHNVLVVNYDTAPGNARLCQIGREEILCLRVSLAPGGNTFCA